MDKGFVLTKEGKAMKHYEINKQLTEYMDKYTDLFAFSGSMICSIGGDVIFDKSYGYASIEHQVKNTSQTKFRIS